MSYLCPHSCEGKTEYGYCRYTWCVNPLHSNLGTAYQGQGVQMAIITNADRIRAMTDEELAGWLAKHNERSAVCPNFGWLDWLRKEVEDGEAP